MNIQFRVDAINHLTGNTMRKAGEVMDLRDDYASALVSRGYAVNLDAKPEPEPEPAHDWESMHTNAIRAMAKDLNVWVRGMKRDAMIEALTNA